MKKLIIISLSLMVAGLMVPVRPAEAKKSSSAMKSFETAAQENLGVIDQWVKYPEKYRQPMLDASLYPETLGRIGRIQTQTRRQFQSHVRKLPRDEQEQVYEIVRYPKLLQALTAGDKPSKKQIKEMSREYPEKAQKAALAVGRKQFDFLKQTQSLYAQANSEFERNISGLPLHIQNSYRELLQVPELLSSMEENLPLSQKMGEAYRVDPTGVNSQLAQWQSEARQRDQEAIADFNDNLNNNPQVKKEMKQAAEDYAKDQGYDVYELDQEPNPTQVYVNINPWPYWFGYPYWYSYSWWRPYPYWWGLGFWFGYGWSPYFWGYPCGGYLGWYWGGYNSFYRYPYLSSYYWRNYNRYRGYYGYNNGYWRGYGNNYYRSVDNWYRTSGRHYFSNRYVNDGRNAARFQQYGKFERGYSNYRRNNPGSSVTRSDYFRSRGVPAARANPSRAYSTQQRTRSTTIRTPSRSGSGQPSTIRRSTTGGSTPRTPGRTRSNNMGMSSGNYPGRTGSWSTGSDRSGGSSPGTFQQRGPGSRGSTYGGSQGSYGGTRSGGISGGGSFRSGGSSGGGFRGGGGGGFRGGGGGGFRGGGGGRR